MTLLYHNQFLLLTIFQSHFTNLIGLTFYFFYSIIFVNTKERFNIMSKLYSKYLSLKKETNSSKIYLFKSGIFYLFIDEDAKMMSPLLQLKLTNLNPTVLKCGFPVNSLEKYMPLLEQTGKTIEIIDLEKNISSSPKKFIITKDVKVN